MPRDLFPSQSSPQEPVLTESPEIKTPSQHRADNADRDQDEDVQNAYTIFRDETDNMELQLSKSSGMRTTCILMFRLCPSAI